ncbi:MAG: sugar ABC transporter permease [Sphaerochaeta sp.]|jgi:inositol-phosphate transport system permease protein|nr:sugar ABC transporter permease [Sphaerochaeta sp.]MDX9915047.1 sugar ABC transporter permease [Sphaerochaeta sp.]
MDQSADLLLKDRATLTADRKAIKRKQRFPFLMMLPFFVPVIVFVVVPIILMLVMSFTDMKFTLKWNFIGFDNYRRIFGYPDMSKILARTLLLVVGNTTLSVLGSIFVVVITTYYLDIVYRRKNLGLLFRIIWLIPNLTPTIVFMFIWRFMFGPEGYGMINKMLAAIGLPAMNWFTNWSMQLLLASMSLSSASGSIILFSSAIRQIPESIVQSAKVDGAGNFYICRRIVLPYLRWPITQKTLWSILGNFTAYESIRLLTGGGPMGSTVTYAYYIYQNAYQYHTYGYGAALSVFMVLMSITMGLIMLRVFQVDKQLRVPRMDI